MITGPIADHIGRSLVFRFDMLFIACLSLSQFFVEEAWHLLVTRLLIGLVLGADYVVSKTLVTEHAPRHFRGRLLSFLAVAWAAGYVFAYLVGFALHDIGDDAWRYMLIASAIPELIVFAFRVGSPESPLWLMRRGLTDLARAIVDRTAGKDIPLPPTSGTEQPRAKFSVLFGPQYRSRTLVGITLYVCQVIPYFALGTFSPLVMESLGVTNKLAAGALYNVFLLTGAIIGMVIIDRLPCRVFLIYSFFIGAVALFASFALVLAAAANLEFIYPPELFPTDVRASGLGLVTAGSRIGSAISTFFLPIIVSGFGVNTVLFGCVGVLVIGGLACWRWAPETRRRSFVEQDADLPAPAPVSSE